VGVATLFIEPGSPWENGYAEIFHSRFRDEFLAMEIFNGINDARTPYGCMETRLQHPTAPQFAGLPDPGRVLPRVCSFNLDQGIGSSRTG
jgi:hypothetical protein